MQQFGSRRLIAFLFGIVVSSLAGLAYADPPTRVARLGYLSGPVSFSPAGEDEWVAASLNRPLVTGDRLWSDAAARVELQIGTAVMRLGPTTSVTLLNLDDRVAQVQLAQGALNIRVRRLDPDQVVEIDTPNLAYVIVRPGQYWISVNPDGSATEVRTSTGQAEVYGEGATYVVDAGRAYRFYGTGLRDYEDLAFPAVDEFDRWARERDRDYDNSISARYVSRDVIGYQDLDAYGTWRAVPEYGNVWIPSRVRSDWAPYRDGHWAWVDPWGWTWVDDAPWGFAVSHYGRWANVGNQWGWIPGPVAARAVYAPALVAFVGGNNFQVAITSGSAGAVGWFALGPRDVYRPAYAVSQNYFTNVNVTNTTINNTSVTNVYNNRNVTNVTYANQQVRGAVIAVPTTAFVQSQPVSRAVLQVPRETLIRAPVSTVAAVAPTQVSVMGAASRGSKPPRQSEERAVVARTAPPAAPVGFAAKEHALTGNPGKPIDTPALAGMRTAAPVPAPKVEVIAPMSKTGPAVAPPPQAANANQRSKGERGARPQPVISGAQPQPLQPAPTTAKPQQRNAAPAQQTVPSMPPQAGGKIEQGNQAVNAPVIARPPQVNAPAAAAVPTEPRSRTETRSQPTTPVTVAQPAVVARPPQRAPTPALPEQRSKTDAANQPKPPAPAAAPAVASVPPEHPRVQPVPTAAPKPMPPPNAQVAPVAGAQPAAKSEQRGNEPRRAKDKKADDPDKGDEEPKRK